MVQVIVRNETQAETIITEATTALFDAFKEANVEFSGCTITLNGSTADGNKTFEQYGVDGGNCRLTAIAHKNNA